jgi:RimJ/RimL family protein N-acetyltransferase
MDTGRPRPPAAGQHERRHAHLHALPAADHPASNAVCRKVGFTLLGETDIEYPPGDIMRCNNRRLEL